MPSGVIQKFHHGGTTLNKFVAATIVLASLTAGAQTTKPTTTAPAKPTTSATAPAKPAAAPKPAVAPKPATTTAPATKPVSNRHYKTADDAFVSSCTGWTASYSKVVKHVGKLTISGSCTAPSNIHLYLSSRKSSAKGTRNYALTQWWVGRAKPSTKTGPVSVKRIVVTNIAPTTVMVGKSSITVSNSSPAPAAPVAMKPAPAKPAVTPAKPAPAPVKK
jgi:hypothetical protein